MARKFIFLIVACLLLIIATSSIFAAEEKPTKAVNPFEMVVFNIGQSKFTVQDISNDSLVVVQTDSTNNKIIELGVEVPYYKDYTALDFQFGIISGSSMIGTQYTLGVKFRLPMHFKFGDIAITNTYRVGALSLVFNENIYGETELFQFGLTGAPSIGIDYFPIRWVGVYCEYSWRFNSILLNKQSLDDGVKENRPYSYGTQGLCLGLKFTF